MPGEAFIPPDELPRSVPRDPDAVQRERDVRRLTEERARVVAAASAAALMHPRVDELGEDPEPIRGGLLSIDPQGDAERKRLQAQVDDLYGMVKELTKAVTRLEANDR